jgi:ferredoxin
MLIGDCASDPPLGATARVLATARAADVVYGLGAVALARGHRQLALAVTDGEARAALARAIAELGAAVTLVDGSDAWPAVAAGARDEVLPATALVAVADAARARGAKAYVTVAGAVAEPAVLACAPATTMAELVARAGGALDDDWVPIAGGAPAGRLVDRAATLAETGAPSLLLILPARHAWVRRLRTTVGDWLWRAASACEGCRACSDACPVGLEAHALVATLATGRDDPYQPSLRDSWYGTRTAPAAFAGCTGCGVCDAVCPSSLSPRALATAVRDRLRVEPATGARRAGIDRALLTLRLGLSEYDRKPVVTLS